MCTQKSGAYMKYNKTDVFKSLTYVLEYSTSWTTLKGVASKCYNGASKILRKLEKLFAKVSSFTSKWKRIQSIQILRYYRH